MYGKVEGDKKIKLIKKIHVITFAFFFPINPVKSANIDSYLWGILPLFINVFVKKTMITALPAVKLIEKI